MNPLDMLSRVIGSNAGTPSAAANTDATGKEEQDPAAAEAAVQKQRSDLLQSVLVAYIAETQQSSCRALELAQSRIGGRQ